MNLFYKILLTLAVIVAVLHVAVSAYLYFRQESLIFFPRTLPADYKFPYATPFEEITLTLDEPGGPVNIHGLYFFADGADADGADADGADAGKPKGVVLYLHGNGSTLAELGDEAAILTAQGVDVFMIDYRGYGKSSGRLAREADLFADSDAAYAYVAARFPESQIVLYGRSLGTGLATRLAARHDVRLLILEAPYYSIQFIVRRVAPFLPPRLLKYPLRTDQWILEVDCPVYLFHGTEDEVLPYQFSQQLAEIIPTKHELFLIDGARHSNLPDTLEYRDAIARILGGL